jgi:hypothetical protein
MKRAPVFADAAFALDGLRDDGRCFGRHRGDERGRIVVRNELHGRQERFERRPIVLVGCHRQGAERAAVKRLFEGDELRARLAFRVPVAPREFQARFDSFRAAVAEERPRQSRQRGKALGHHALKRMEKQIRRVQ